jgi:spermidine/putrescine transport system permease protein
VKHGLLQSIGRLLGWAALAIVLLGMYLPVAMTMLFSFTASRTATVWRGFSLSGYERLPHDAELWKGLEASIAIGSAASTISVIVGTLAALGLRRWLPRPRAAAQGLLALPLVTPDIILALSLAVFFSTLGVRQGWHTVVLAHCTFGISYAFVVMSAAVADLDDTLYAAALDSGATRWQAFWRVTVPILAPSLVIAWLFVFALSFDDFLITFMTKGPGSDTLPIEVYSQLRFGIKTQTVALFVVLFFVTLAGALVAARLSRRKEIAL